MTFSHDTFISPFTWRYGSETMRQIWSETHKRRLMRQVWVALAKGQHAAGIVSSAQLADLVAHQANVDIERSQEIERETRHDVMAEIRCYAEQCQIGGGIIHLGATSADITDNADVLRQKAAGTLLATNLVELLLAFARQIDAWATHPIMAQTHIQPAEPTTVGYRLAVYAQDLLDDYEELSRLLESLRGKGLKGAVGTQASFTELLADNQMTATEMEAIAMAELQLPYFLIATQTYSRQQDLRLLNVLANIASSLHKFAFDFRILQSPQIGEWAEPFAKKQVGSSAMPFKRNPINSENICSLARYVAGLPSVAWDNASQAILERSLDDSANRRLFIAEGFLATEEIIKRTHRLVEEMQFNKVAMARNMATYGPFAATERVLMAAVGAGASRQDAHEWLRDASLAAWEVVQSNGPNPLIELLCEHEELAQFLPDDKIRALMSAQAHVGTAPERAAQFAAMLTVRLDTDSI